MKKLIVVALCAVLFSVVASAQPRALGLRGGYGAELSYQHSLGANFAEIDLGLGYANTFHLTGVYNFNIGNAEAFGFYAGPGASVGMYNFTNSDGNKALGLSLAVVGQIGAEYVFSSIPLQISLDWRPAFRFIGDPGFGWQGFALGVRYMF